MDTFILGTAGHIDHGKSSLIKALTGIETDRLEEEKRRGISIVLGYANMLFPSGISVGIVDVPGHAKFIKTMISGSAGMDGVLLAIAADDGVMAQTKEHLLILKLLGIDLIIPVITKIDIVSDEIILEREAEARDFLKLYGYDKSAENILKVSVKSGEGIDGLKKEIEKAAKEYNLKSSLKPVPTKVFLPIDRIISSKGFGTILAGTLKYGSFSAGDEIQIMPSGLTARIKSIESHNKPVETARKSMRISVNVPSVKKESVKLGDVISAKDSLAVSDSIFTKVFYDFENKKDLKSHILLSFMTGGAYVNSKIIIFNADKRIRPGEYSYALFKLNDKISVMAKEKFIIRDIGAGRTVGGGFIIDPLPDYGYEESKKSIYETMVSDDIKEAVYGFIAINGGSAIEKIYKKLNINFTDFTAVINELKRDGRIITDDKYKFAFLKEDFDAGSSLLVKIINENSKDENFNFKKRLNKQELYVIFEQNFNKPGAVGLFDIIVEDLLSKKEVLYYDGNIIPKGLEHSASEAVIPAEYINIAEKIENLLNSNGNSVPDFAELENKIKVNKKILNYITALMVKQGKLVKVKPDIYYLKGQIDGIKFKLDYFFEKEERLGPKDMKEIAGVSRKYAIPLLEYFDNTGYTVKKGDYRIKKAEI
ncbi:MAG: selenocysteine-specific translation elongation factor [Deltaproteobacteria bacterium]|nr:selenocysteine-specific translation elongation factor [Deltaproteobacteria bacterium]